MDNEQKQEYLELADRIESGEYFYDARNWYIRKYVFGFIERTYLIILIFAFIILGFFLFSYYSAILPIKKSLPVKVNISSAADFSTRITYLGNKEKSFDVNDVFIKYFASRFVQAIESYDFRENFKQLRINKNIIDALASNDIKVYYMDKISIRNADSLLLKYKKKISRAIIVDNERVEIAPFSEKSTVSSSFDDKRSEDDIKKYAATVNFDAIETDNSGVQNKTKWQAKIILSFQTIKYNYKEKDFTPLNFKVLNYESKRTD
jgi:type IV secretory pathway component VirB8